jgi:hypothetical protein
MPHSEWIRCDGDQPFGIADLVPAIHGWTDPVAEVVIERMRLLGRWREYRFRLLRREGSPGPRGPGEPPLVTVTIDGSTGRP